MARAIGAAAVLALAVSGCSVDEVVEGNDEVHAPSAPAEAGTDARLPGLPTADEARDQLAGLTVAEPRPMSGYSRDHFPHWSTTDGCTTRQTVLARDGSDVTVDVDCQPASGSWVSAYDGETFEDPGDLDIDHIVPLANAWRSGADSWTDDRREELANDLAGPQLLAVSAASNRSKGDQSPDEWLPPAEDFHCAYAIAWTAVKDSYELTVTAAERETLSALLDGCP